MTFQMEEKNVYHVRFPDLQHLQCEELVRIPTWKQYTFQQFAEDTLVLLEI